MVVLLIALGVSSGILSAIILHGPARKVEGFYDMSPNESRVLNYSSTWCSSVSVEAKPYKDIRFYLLKEMPAVSDYETFSIRQDFETLPNQVNYYKFHLFPGSVVNITTCAVLEEYVGEAYVILIKGKSNFKKWQDSLYLDNTVVESSVRVVDLCDNSSQVWDLISNVTYEADYYLVFFRHPSGDAMIKVFLQFYRSKLFVANDNVLNYFASSTGYETLYLDVSYGQKNPVLVSTSPPKQTDEDIVWLSTSTIIFKCQDRYIFYVFIGIGLSVLSLIVALVFCSCWFSIPKSKYTSLTASGPVNSYQTFN